MNTDLLRRILDKARDDAPNASEADDIRGLLIDLDTLDGRDVAELVTDAKTLADVRKHISAQPFDVQEYEADPEHDEEAHIRIAELTPGSFAAWLGDLEYVAS